MDQNEIAERALSLPDQARKMVILTNDDYLRATDLLKDIKIFLVGVEKTLGPGKKAAWNSYKIAKKTMDDIEAKAKEAEDILKPMISAFKERQEKERLEKERELQLLEEARKIAEAEAAEARGDHAEAEAILAEPIVPVIVVNPTPKVNGISTHKIWKFRITDPLKVPREYLMVDEVKIGAIVRALKGQTRIEGVETYSEDVVTVRTE